MARTKHLVLTTIRVPDVLEGYWTNFRDHGRLDEVKVWIVGDRKTPRSVADLAVSLSRKGLESVFLDPGSQEDWSARFSDLYAHLPWNNETRRNIGYLKALEDGCEVLISIDDDNWPTEDDFVGRHASTGRAVDVRLVTHPQGFVNVCEMLECENDALVYPRGFPFSLRGRHSGGFPASSVSARVRVGATEGLWLGDPDVDAVTWLSGPVRVRRYVGPDQVVLNQDTWTPLNTQNTSVARALIPAFFCVPMGSPVPGGRIERYGDIWAGYFLQAVAQGTDYHVAVGRPIVDHRRNPHLPLDDLRYEYWGMLLSDWLLTELREHFRPCDATICARMRELADFLDRHSVQHLPAWVPTEVRGFINNVANGTRAWANACTSIGV